MLLCQVVFSVGPIAVARGAPPHPGVDRWGAVGGWLQLLIRKLGWGE